MGRRRREMAEFKRALAGAGSTMLSTPERVKYSPDQARDEQGRWSAGGYSARAEAGLPSVHSWFAERNHGRGVWSPAAHGIPMGEAHPSIGSGRLSVNPQNGQYISPTAHLERGTEETHFERDRHGTWRQTGQSSYGQSYGGRASVGPEAAGHLESAYQAARATFEAHGLPTEGL